MPSGKSSPRELLHASIDALEAARRALLAGEEEGLPSLHRIARFLGKAAPDLEVPRLRIAAANLESAAAQEAPDRATKLLEELRVVVSGKGSEEALVLVVEDNPDVAGVLCARLAGANRRVLLARTGEEALGILQANEVSLMVLDLCLPDMDGRDIIARLRWSPKDSGVRIIVLTADAARHTKAECYALGADEYFEKPANLQALSAAVSAVLQRGRDISREVQTDVLTGLANRAAFENAFERASLLALREGRPLSIAILDFDRFKDVNDTFGHASGDEVLRTAAREIAEALRRTDFLARWGGEEFVALFPNAAPPDAARALEKSLVRFRELDFPRPGGRAFHVSFSAGVAAVRAADSVGDAVARADRRLYQAKASGRNRIHHESKADAESPMR